MTAQSAKHQESLEELKRLQQALPPTARTDTPGHLSWKLETLSALEDLFGREAGLVREFERLMQAVEERALWEYTEWPANQFMAKAIRKATEAAAAASSEKEQTTGEVTSRRVFVVHGHDESAREKVARFLEKLDLEPIILHEQANAGLTVIEKFTQHANVAFAVVLLTADDVGGPKGASLAELQVRARQNVLMELGYFIGTLGRARVCALVQPGVEIPSDYRGVLYIDLDKAGAWRTQVAREMKIAGLSIDLNKAL